MYYNESQLSYGFGRQSHLSMPARSELFSSNINSPYKTIFDPIHGHITFSKIMWDIIDTPQFQRLRNLRQLSTSYFVYPGNNHSRFEHCLGTGFLSRDLINRCFEIVQNDEDQKEIEYLKECVSIAGLCHDIGHGPFSHSFDLILGSMNINWWDHETFGGRIIEY